MFAGEGSAQASSKHHIHMSSTVQKAKPPYKRKESVFLQDHKERRASSWRHCRGSINQVEHLSAYNSLPLCTAQAAPHSHACIETASSCCRASIR